MLTTKDQEEIASTYSIKHPSVINLTQIMCSPHDLSNWIYSSKEYNKDIDKYVH